MGNRLTFEIIPEVIPEDGEERVVVLSHDQTVFSILIVWFPIGPVKPAHSFVLGEVFKKSMEIYVLKVTFCVELKGKNPSIV